MDLLSILGIIIGFGAIIGGNFMEGGGVTSLLNGPAAFIVIGGTLGAALLQTPKRNLKRAFTVLPWIFRPPVTSFNDRSLGDRCP